MESIDSTSRVGWWGLEKTASVQIFILHLVAMRPQAGILTSQLFYISEMEIIKNNTYITGLFENKMNQYKQRTSK
jgi:hypothetical protein